MLIGRKLGMVRLYDGGGRARAVTAIELGPNRVTQLRTADRDGYEAVQVGYSGNRKRLTRPALGHLRAAGVEETLARLGEFRVDSTAGYQLGQRLDVSQFQPGAYVDVTADSKGRGFSGGVRRWGFHGGPKTHGQSDRHRAPGSIGSGTTPGRVWKGQHMAGHMGAVRITVRNLLVVATDDARNLIFVQGSVPGPQRGLVAVRNGRRAALANFAPAVLADAGEVAPAASVDAEAPADGAGA